METKATLYRMEHPYNIGARIEVYGHARMGWYEWRIIAKDGEVLKDTKNQGYGNPAIALRDALIYATTDW